MSGARAGEKPTGRPQIAGAYGQDGSGCGARGGWGPFLMPPPRLEEKKEPGAAAIEGQRLCLPYKQ